MSKIETIASNVNTPEKAESRELTASEPSRELTVDELAQASGGIIAILIGLGGGPYEPPPPTKPGRGPV